jgi:hypothetical protein
MLYLIEYNNKWIRKCKTLIKTEACIIVYKYKRISEQFGWFKKWDIFKMSEFEGVRNG